MANYPVSNGVTSDGIVLNYYDSMFIYSGGTANNTTFNSGGRMLVSSGGTAKSTTINSGGRMFVSSGGTANSTTVNAGGTMYVSSGGTALSIDWTPCVGHIGIANGAYATFVSQYSGVYFGSNNQLLSNAALMESQTVTGLSGIMYVMSGGIVNNTTINSSGTLYISSGGTANSTTVNESGWMYVSSGGTANSTTINSGGRMYVMSGGTANSTTINSGGYLFVSNGGTALNIDWTPCNGYIKIADGAYVTFVSQYSGVYYGSQGQLLAHATEMESVTVRDVMYVMSGGTAINITVLGSVYSGVSGAGTNYASTYVMSGGTANDTTVDAGGILYVSNGGTANSTIIKGEGYNGYNGSMYVSSGGTADNTTVSSYGYLYVLNGGTANSTTVNSGGSMLVSSGGTAINTTVSGGNLYVSSGGKLTGHMTFESGSINISGGGIVDFDLTQTSAGAVALINDLSFVPGGFLYTLTVDGTQESGDYVLAEGASIFNSTISVMNTSGATLGLISTGKKLVTQDASYTLKLTGSTLSVTVEKPSFFTGAFDGGDKALLAREYEDMAVIWKDGASWKLNQDLKLGTFAGTGDFDGDGRTDVLRLHYTGLVIGEMSNGDGTFSGTLLNKLGAGWSIAGIGDFNGNGTDDVLVANPAGASETTGLVGYWEGGTTWNIINGSTAEWECIATGDFNGDGKCDMLWRNKFLDESGQTFNAFCTWIVDPPSGETDWRMVSVANPAEWKFLCAGDFDGDSTSDIAMINDAGVVGIWGISDGWLSSWSILSAVNTAEWSLVGVGDFNGDGTDDIAWFNADAGIAGFWQIENKELSAWQNLATLL